MKRFYYDFHVHSCLSPCGDDDMTPNNIAGMEKLNEIDIAALTDHNSCLNCPAFFEAAERYGVIPIAGMELTTAEDIHVVCLFETPECGLKFGEEIDSHRPKILNRPSIFGKQLILNGDDEIIGEEEKLLINASDLSLEQAFSLVKSYGGICYPAHVDREANGIIAALGTFPDTPEFAFAEFHDKENIVKYRQLYPILTQKEVLVSSDAHYLQNLPEKGEYIELPDGSPQSVRAALFQKLRSGRI